MNHETGLDKYAAQAFGDRGRVYRYKVDENYSEGANDQPNGEKPTFNLNGEFAEKLIIDVE